MAGVPVGVGQRAQLGRGQGRLRAYGGQLGPRHLRLGAQGMSQQQSLVEACRLLLLAQIEGGLSLRKLVAGTKRGCSLSRGGQYALGSGSILQRQQNLCLQLRRLGHEDALWIALGKAVQQRRGCLLIAHIMIGARIQKIGVVGQLSARLPRQSKIGNRLAVTLVEQISVSQSQIRRARRLAGVALRVLGHAGIGRRSAHRG